MSALTHYYTHLLNQGMTHPQALDRLAVVQNKFASDRQRRWYWSNLGKQGGPKEWRKGKSGGGGNPKSGPGIANIPWVMPSATGGQLSVAAAKDLQISLHDLYQRNPDFRDAAEMLNAQTTMDAKADVVQAVMRAVEAGRDPKSDSRVLKARSNYEVSDQDVEEWADRTPGYLRTVDQAPRSPVPLFRGGRLGNVQPGGVVELDTPSSATDTWDVAAHYSKNRDVLVISPGARALPVSLTQAASGGPEGGVAAHRAQREPYRERQPVYANASLDSDNEVMLRGRFRVKSVKTEERTYRDQLTGKKKTKLFRIVEVEPEPADA